MYFSQYKLKKNSAIKKNRTKGGSSRNIRKGLLRFVVIAIIIIAIVPAVYLADSAYRLVSGKTVKQKMTAIDHHFIVTSVRVTGNNIVSMEELNPYLKDVKGANVFGFDLDRLAKKLIGNPWIRNVSVRREPPSSIAVNIVERTPVVYINSKRGLYIADEEGTLLREKDGVTFGLPVVYGIPVDGLKTGENIRSNALMSAIHVRNELSSLPWIELSQTAIEVDHRSDITLHLSGFRIRLGHDKYRDKLIRFNEIARDLRGKGILYREVDLRFNNQVVVQTL